MEIREFRPDDLDAVLALNVRATDVEADPGRSRIINPDLLDIAGVYHRDGAFLIGTIEGEVVAMGAIRRLDAGTFELKRMRVSIAQQRNGLAARIVAELERRAVRLGADRIILDTTERQVAAQRLYERCGYTLTHHSTLTNEHGTFALVHYRKELRTGT